MTTRRFQLEGDSVEALHARVRHEHGPHARIVALEKVTRGGIAGFLARQTFEATIEVDGDAESHQTGIAALIAEADEADETLSLAVSTSGAQFDEVLQSLEAETRPAPVAEPEWTTTLVPEQMRALEMHSRPELVANSAASSSAPTVHLLSAPGALVAFIGLDSLPLDAARRTSGVLAVAGHGRPQGIRHIVDRRTAYLARADAVAEDAPVVLAWRLSSALASADELRDLPGLQADQVWAIVDARHKSEDTATWVRMISATVGVDAVFAVGIDQTTSPGSVDALGVPRGILGEQPHSRGTFNADSDENSERIG